MKKKKIIGTLLTLCLLAGIPHTVSASSDTTDTVLPQEISAPVYSIAPETTKLSDQAIAIKWDCENDAFVKDYSRSSSTRAAVMIAIEYTSSALQPLDKSLMGEFNPRRMGPYASKLPIRCAIL